MYSWRLRRLSVIEKLGGLAAAFLTSAAAAVASSFLSSTESNGVAGGAHLRSRCGLRTLDDGWLSSHLLGDLGRLLVDGRHFGYGFLGGFGSER